MDTIINFVSSKFLTPVWNFLDGKKTAITSAVGIITGTSALVAEFVPLLQAHDVAGLLQHLKALPSDPSYLLVAGSCLAIGIGHKIDKASTTSDVTVVNVAPSEPLK